MEAVLADALWKAGVKPLSRINRPYAEYDQGEPGDFDEELSEEYQQT